MSRRTQTMLTTAKNLLRPKPEKEVPEKILKKRIQAKQYYDRFSLPLLNLSVGENIRVKISGKTWSLGKVFRKVAPGSYLVNVREQIYRRNRSFIGHTAEQYINESMYEDAPMRTDKNNLLSSSDAVPEHEDPRLTRTPSLLTNFAFVVYLLFCVVFFYL